MGQWFVFSSTTGYRDEKRRDYQRCWCPAPSQLGDQMPVILDPQIYLLSDIKKHSGSYYLYRCPFTFDGFLALSIRTSFHYFSPVFAAYWSVVTTIDGCQLQEEPEGNSPPFSVYVSLGSLAPSHSILHLWRGVSIIIRSSLSFLPHCWTPHGHGHLKGHATA